MIPVTRRKVEECFFIHNCFGSFFSGILNWFADDFYPRFNYKVVGTYDKAVKFFKDKKQMGVDPSSNILPSLSLDPILDFSNEERGGRFLWQHSTLAPGLGMRLWNSIDLKEQNVTVTPVFSRYQGTFDVIFWLSSIYELIDFRVQLLQFCGGYNRWIRPQYLWTYLILPEKIENFETDPDNKIKLDWSNTYADIIHVDTINKQRMAHPIALDGIWKLDSLSDSSTKYGGDQVSEFKLSATFTYEINIPTYMVLSNYVDPLIKFQFSLGETFTKYPLASPFRILKAVSEISSTQQYVEPNFSLFKIQNDLLERENLIKEFDTNVSWPTEIQHYNTIVNGKLIKIDNSWLSNPINKVRKDHIIYFDQYKDEYLPLIRKCCAVISKKGTMTDTLFRKCELLKKPLLSNLTDEDYSFIEPYFNQDVTFDSYNQKIYKGLLDIIESESNDPYTGLKTVEKLKENDIELYNQAVDYSKKHSIGETLPEHIGGPVYSNEQQKRLIKDECDGIQSQFSLGYIIDGGSIAALKIYIDKDLMVSPRDYTLINNTTLLFNTPPPKGSNIYSGGNYLIIKESKLMGIYIFSEDDLSKTDPITIPLPSPINNIDELVLLSYGGRLEYETEYTIDLQTQIASITLKPVLNEVIEFFYYKY